MEQLAEEIIQLAKTYRVDDVYLMPKKDFYEFSIRDSQSLIPVRRCTLEDGERFISYMKYQANLDIGEKRRPQSGSFTFSKGEFQIEIRISVIANYKMQQSLVIRLLHQNTTLGMGFYTYFPKDLRKLSSYLHVKSGLILFSGPVSSGKTTTMYQLLKVLMKRRKLQVITMEDPVEIFDEQFLQTEVNEKAGVTYEVLIKHALRHHPDILLIGEIRDEETAKMVIRGALTGHLMLATVHAKDCKGVIARLVELGISYDLLKQTLLMVSSQRLLARYCPICKENCHLHCNHIPLEHKKGTLFEQLSGSQLENYLSSPQSSASTTHSFNRKLRKAYALGYISRSTYEQFAIL